MAEKVKLEVAAKMLGVRVEVAAFALLMEKRLAEKDAEMGGNSWKQSTAMNLRHYPSLYADALRSAVELERYDAFSQELVARKAADVANFAMMIADVVGGLQK